MTLGTGSKPHRRDALPRILVRSLGAEFSQTVALHLEQPPQRLLRSARAYGVENKVMWMKSDGRFGPPIIGIVLFLAGVADPAGRCGIL